MVSAKGDQSKNASKCVQKNDGSLLFLLISLDLLSFSFCFLVGTNSIKRCWGHDGTLVRHHVYRLTDLWVDSLETPTSR